MAVSKRSFVHVKARHKEGEGKRKEGQRERGREGEREEGGERENEYCILMCLCQQLFYFWSLLLYICAIHASWTMLCS